MINIKIDGNKKSFEIAGNPATLKAEILRLAQMVSADKDVYDLFQLVPEIHDIVKNDNKRFTDEEREATWVVLDAMMSDYISNID